MDIHPTYSCLLGRPLIHSARVVTSMLHQRLELLVNNNLVVVEGEEDLMVCPIGEELKNVNVEMVCPIGEELKNVEFPMASLKDALTFIRSGHPVGWGRMLELPNKNDHSGL